MKKLFTVIVFLLVAGLVFSQETGKEYLVHMDTPERLMEYFVETIRNGDFENTVNLFAFSHDENVRLLDNREEMLYMGSILQNQPITLPKSYTPIIKYYLLNRYVDYIRRFLFELLLPETFRDLKDFELHNLCEYDYEQDIELYIRSLNSDRLRALRLVRIDPVDFDEPYRSSDSLKNRNETEQRIYGYNDVSQYTVLYAFNCSYYIGAVTLYKYGNYWYIGEFRANAANISINIIIPATVKEYESKLK
jgi:hypothetical protein